MTFAINRDNFKNEKIYKFFLVMIFLLFTCRLIGLDKDLPNFGLTFYQAKDEGQYSMMALNAYNNGNLLTIEEMELIINPTFRANIIGNLLQFLSMKTFGDNYYAFRLPYMFFSFGSFLLLYLTMKKNIEVYKLPQVSKWFILYIMLYIVFDFSFLMSSRVVENSSLRSFITILCAYLWIKYYDCDVKKYFILGFFSIIAIFFVYYSNVHILVTSVLIGGVKFLQCLLKKENNFKCFIKFWCLGFFIGHILVEIYYFVVWKSGCWTNFFTSIGAFSDRIVGTPQNIETTLLNYFKGFLTFWCSNMFFYNFSILILAIVSMCLAIVFAIKYLDENLLFILGCVFVLLLQSTFTNDWMERKTVSIYPIIYIGIFLTFSLLKIKKYSLSKKMIKAVCLFSFLLSFPLLYAMFRFRVSRNYFVDFEMMDINLWGILTCIQLVFLFLFVIGVFVKKRTICINAIMLGLSFSIVLNCYFSTKYVYMYENYSEKEAMIGIGEIVGNEYVAGPYTYGYTLYNDIKPIWNVENYCIEYIEAGKIKYFCDYSKGPYYVRLMNPEKDFSLVQDFERKLIAQGNEYPIGVFIKND